MKFIVCFLLFVSACSNPNLSVKLIAELPKSKMQWSATGFLVRDDNGNSHLVTAGHFCEAALAMRAFVEIEYLDGEKYTARAGKYVVKKIGVGVDLCELVYLEKANHHMKGLELASEWRAMEPITVIGAPWGIYPAKTEGFLIGYHDGFLLASCLALPGNSGSPVLNKDGEVLGMLVVGAEHLFGSVPFWQIKQFVNE